MSGRSGSLTGLGVFVRAFLRRDRWMVLWFALGVALLYVSQAISVDGLYRTQAEFDRAAASMEHNSAFVAMAGPARALNTAGGQVTWQASAFGAILVGLMAMFLVGRHTRAEEESGRDELVRAAVVGREAPMTAALLVVLIGSLCVGGAVTLSLVGYGLATAGAVSLGLGLLLCGAAYGGVALLAAQLTSSTRSMYGITGAVIGVSYGLRAVGDVGNSVLSWLSPIGWYQGMHAYSGERWWPALLLGGLAVLASAAAYAVFDRRDIGAGVWAARPGPADAAPTLGTPWGLAWRLQRPSVYGWTLGLFLAGLAYGSIGKDVGTLMGDSTFAKEMFGLDKGDLVNAFYATSSLMLVLIASGFAIGSALRPHGEEDAGRVEALLAAGSSRTGWLAGHAAVTVLGSVVVVVLAGVGVAGGYALVTGSAASSGELLAASVSRLPGVLLLGALARLLFGLLPRFAWLAWLALAFCFVVMLFGEALRFPDWITAISPFEHLADVPADPMAWAPFLVVLLLAASVSAAGFAAFRRRDLLT